MMVPRHGALALSSIDFLKSILVKMFCCSMKGRSLLAAEKWLSSTPGGSLP
jgi:hypothetical protein